MNSIRERGAVVRITGNTLRFRKGPNNSTLEEFRKLHRGSDAPFRRKTSLSARGGKEEENIPDNLNRRIM